MDYLAFERRVLRLMFRTNSPLTPVHCAYHLELPVAEARSHLDSMVTQGILDLDSDEGGHLVYHYPLRPDLSSLPPPPSSRRRRRRRRAARAATNRALVLHHAAPPAAVPSALPASLEGGERYSPAAAAALSFFLPGVGQLYSGRVPQGIGWMLATGLGYLMFLVPGLILHICCVVNAAAIPTRLPSLGRAHES